MSWFKPDPPAQPTPPDPRVVSAAQTGSNINTAVSNSYLQNANQYGPNGSTQFSVSGYHTVTDPSNGQSYQIPQFDQTTTLSPDQQRLHDQQTAMGSQMNTIAGQQLTRLGNVLNTPISAPSGSLQRNVNMQQAPTSVSMTSVPTEFGQTAGNIQYGLGPTDFSADRQRVTNDINSRLNPQLALDRAQLDTQLANEGFTRGDAGYNTGMDAFNRQANDARVQADLAGGQEQSRLFGLDLQQGQFNNAAQQQDYGQQLGRGQYAQQGAQLNNTNSLAQGQFAQQGVQQNNQSALQAGQFANSAYGQQLQTDMALRNQPINEVSALMSGGQVTLPQFQGYQSGSVANTPVGDYYMQNAQMANQNYQQQVQANAQQNAAFYGGVGNFVGAGLMGGLSPGGFLRSSDRRIKENIEQIGNLANGLPLYFFNYIGNPNREIGLMAQDVEKVKPEAVVEIGGIKHVNYDLAVR